MAATLLGHSSLKSRRNLKPQFGFSGEARKLVTKRKPVGNAIRFSLVARDPVCRAMSLDNADTYASRYQKMCTWKGQTTFFCRGNFFCPSNDSALAHGSKCATQGAFNPAFALAVMTFEPLQNYPMKRREKMGVRGFRKFRVAPRKSALLCEREKALWEWTFCAVFVSCQ